jgi:hypothetical protein
MRTTADKPVPVFITVRDRLNPLKALVAWLEQTGEAEITLIDNDSAYPPLLEFLASTSFRVVNAGWNAGPRVAWLTGLVQEVGLDRPYVVTDPDIVPDEECPADLLAHMARLLHRYPDVDRIGVGLRIDDLPVDGIHTRSVVAWESQFWNHEVEPGVFEADVDTTFALYRPGRRHPGGRSLRTGAPYVARHLPWYERGKVNEELAFYRARADPTVNSWDLEQLPPYLQELIEKSAAGRI